MSRTTRWLVLLAILSIAIILRFWHLASLPPGFYYGEAYEGLQGWQIFTDPAYRPIFLTGNGGVPPLNAYAQALMFGLFHLFGQETGPLTVRMTSASFGVLGVLALYGLARELQKLDAQNSRLSVAFPLFAAASLAVMRWHIHFSRIGIEPILVPFIWASALWFFLHGWRTGQPVSFVGSGILLGAALYAYQSAWVIPLLMIPVSILLLFQKLALNKGAWSISHLTTSIFDLQSRQNVGLLITVIVAFLLFMPLGWYAWQHPNIVFLRSTQVTLGGTRSREANETVWHNLWATAKMFGPFGAPGDQNIRRNIPGAPALNLWLALPFYLGLCVAVWRIHLPSYAIVLIGLVGLLLPGVFTTEAPHFHRILGASAPTALLCAIGLDGLWQWRFKFHAEHSDLMTDNRSTTTTERCQSIARGLRSVVRGRALGWVSLCLLLLGGLTSAQEYFVRWASLPALYDKFDAELWEIGQQILAQPPDIPIYVTPHDLNHPTLNFALQTMHHTAPISFDGRHVFPLTAQISAKSELYIVLEDEDFRTNLLLPEIFPTAIIQPTRRDQQGQEQPRYYIRPANAVPQRPPQHALSATLGDGIALLGYDIQPAKVQAGKFLYLQLHWLVQSTPTDDWTVFTHVLAKDAMGEKRLVAGYDSPPGAGSLPTTRWQAGWRILDEYQVPLPTDLAAGEYELEIGLYKTSGEHLPSNETGLPLGKVKIVR